MVSGTNGPCLPTNNTASSWHVAEAGTIRVEFDASLPMRSSRLMVRADRVARRYLAQTADPYHPPGHSVGERVPKGGSSCANCSWLRAKATRCANERFQLWRREEEGAEDPGLLPAPADEYCCDLWAEK